MKSSAVRRRAGVEDIHTAWGGEKQLKSIELEACWFFLNWTTTRSIRHALFTSYPAQANTRLEWGTRLRV
jgi:hypothetical protein